MKHEQLTVIICYTHTDGVSHIYSHVETRSPTKVITIGIKAGAGEQPNKPQQSQYCVNIHTLVRVLYCKQKYDKLFDLNQTE